MKVRVSGMVWLPKAEIKSDVLDYFRKKLFIVPRKLGNFGGDEDIKPSPILCWSETPDEFGVPRAFWFATAKGKYKYEWDLSLGNKIDIKSNLKQEGPYAEQGEVIDKLLDYYKLVIDPGGRVEFEDNYDNKPFGMSLGGIFQADPGFGKTNVALELIARLGVTTVILVHKEFLLTQWVRRINTWLPNAKVGVVRGSKCDFKDKDIVVAMIESLALEDGNRYPSEFYDWPGLLIVDECHRVSAPTWNPVPMMFSSVLRLGLTATPRRKDGADDVFWWHIGPVICKAKTEMPKPHVRMIQIPKPFSAPGVLSRQESNDAIVVTTLSRLTARNWRITAETIKALKSPQKRKIMILSERLDHLRKLESELRLALKKDRDLSKEDITTSFYVGEWFTGEVVPRLVPKEWPMDESGREKAIKLIYTSISRRKGYNGKIGKRMMVDKRGIAFIDEYGDHPQEKTHTVFVKGYDMRCLDSDEDHDDDVIVSVILEDLFDKQLFDLAAWFSIQQKKREKVRKTTKEEQFEAESARVIYATFQMVAEGVDLPAVDTLGLATPVSDVEQAVGRARRYCLPDPDDPEKCEHFCPWKAGECKGKGQPIVFDIVDIGFPICSKRERWRKNWYWNNEFKVATGE